MPGGIEPGGRSEGPGGRPDLLTGGSDDNQPVSAKDGDDWHAKKIWVSLNRGASDRLSVALDAMVADGGTDGVDHRGAISVAATAVPRRRVAALRTDEQWPN